MLKTSMSCSSSNQLSFLSQLPQYLACIDYISWWNQSPFFSPKSPRTFRKLMQVIVVEKLHFGYHADTKNPKISKHTACSFFVLFSFIVSKNFLEIPTNNNHAVRS